MRERTRRPFRDHLGELGWAALLFETIMLAVGWS